ncbi:troponin I isoform X1 [Folsomia candida]|uniref:troponin I isoform X1 n=1 Tax=Folsomia candida TaxID=158441 RepID=UPI000B905B85|nr:troponin I isoform X1 [Folsomia candida]
MADDERKKKQAVIDAKKAEVRARLEQQAAAKKGKKGFMTPERKKKLRLLLRKKAAEELKKEQERKAAERRRIIEERCGKPKNVDDASEGDLKSIVQEYKAKCDELESIKWDLEYATLRKEYDINELNIQVNDLRGKFVKPTLKKVSKYENKFAKLQKKAAEFNFRNQLKQTKKKEFDMEEAEKGLAGAKVKPEWTKDKKPDAEAEA